MSPGKGLGGRKFGRNLSQKLGERRSVPSGFERRGAVRIGDLLAMVHVCFSGGFSLAQVAWLRAFLKQTARSDFPMKQEVRRRQVAVIRGRCDCTIGPQFCFPLKEDAPACVIICTAIRSKRLRDFCVYLVSAASRLRAA